MATAKEPTQTGTATSSGAVQVGQEDRKRRGGWWPWALLGLLLLIGLVYFIARGGNDAATQSGMQQGESATGAGGEEVTADSGGDTAGGAEGDDAAADARDGVGGEATGAEDPGSVTPEEGADLFPISAETDLAAVAGQDITGEGVLVQEIVEGEGFWIGASESDRVFAHMSADATPDFELTEGQRVNFDGFMKENPPEDSAEVHNLPEGQSADQHRAQGHHIELRSLEQA